MTKPSSMAAFLTHLFDVWNAQRIQYLVLRNYETLPEHTGNDVDILLDPSQQGEARKILGQVAHANGWRIHNIGDFSCRAYYLFHEETLEQVHLDLMCGDMWYSFRFVDHNLLLDARRPIKNFYKPDPVHEASVNLMTRLIYGGYVKEKYRSEIQQVAKAQPNEFVEVLTPWLGGYLSEYIVSNAQEGQWQDIEAQTGRIRTKVVVANLKHPVSFLAAVLSDISRFGRRWFKSPGLSVVFLGPDGCGKTSVSNELKQQLLKTFYPERSIHCHWKPIRPKEDAVEPTEDPHGQPARNRILSLLFFTYHYLPFLWGWWRYIKPVLFSGGLAVIDRYYYDFFVDLRRYRLSLPPWLVRLGFVIVKKPDRVFCLDADPKILQARKQEVSFEECARQREAYRALAEKLPNGQVIDASKPLEDVVRDVQAVLLSYMAGRVENRYKMHSHRMSSKQTT